MLGCRDMSARVSVDGYVRLAKINSEVSSWFIVEEVELLSGGSSKST